MVSRPVAAVLTGPRIGAVVGPSTDEPLHALFVVVAVAIAFANAALVRAAATGWRGSD